MAELLLSVVAPCHNEEASLPAFVERMAAACEAVAPGRYEILLVNDGSSDATWRSIIGLSLKNRALVGVNLSRNYGHQLAATAGLELAKGERVLLIDADLQDPPELLTEMMARMDEGFDVVFGQRRTRAKETVFKLATANLYYRFLGSLSEVKIPRNVGDFRLMSRRVVDRLNAMPEQDRFIRGMVAWLGGRQTSVLYDRDPRFAGETSYTLSKMVKLAVAGVTSFSTTPLRFATIMAGTGVVIGLGILAYVLVGFLTGNVEPGWTSLALLTVFFGVGQFGCLAIMGAYLGRVFKEAKGRPLYFIDEVISSEREAVSAPQLAAEPSPQPATLRKAG